MIQVVIRVIYQSLSESFSESCSQVVGYNDMMAETRQRQELYTVMERCVCVGVMERCV